MRGILASVVLVLAAHASLRAAADAASAARIAPLVVRALAYERTLLARSGPSVDIVIFHAGSSAGDARDLERAFASMGALEAQGRPVVVRRVAFSGGALAAEAAGEGDVFIVAEGLDSQLASIASAARRRRVLTIGLARSYVENGSLLAIYMVDGRPRIVVNMAQVRAYGTQLSSQLLRLCEVL